YQVYMTYMYFSFFFIPIFKWNRRFFVEMSCCGAVYELDPEVGKRLLRGEEVEITESDLTLRQDGNGNPWTGSDASHRHKVCPSCGFETDEDFSYCPKCGKPL
ncbi:zinc ribbon domain-containing protein, partial [Clostridium sp.]